MEFIPELNQGGPPLFLLTYDKPNTHKLPLISTPLCDLPALKSFPKN